MARIAIGGFQHETNTFAPSPADYAAFEAGGGWPGVQYGEPLFGAVAGANIPAAGAIDALRAAGHQLVGTAWAVASPSAQVTRDAPAWFHPGRSATLRLGPKIVLAHFGELHPDTLRVLDMAGPVAAFEAFIEALPPRRDKKLARAPLEEVDLLPIHRDFAFVLGAEGDMICTPDDARATAAHHKVKATILPGLAHMLMLEPDWAHAAKALEGWLATLD